MTKIYNYVVGIVGSNAFKDTDWTGNFIYFHLLPTDLGGYPGNYFPAPKTPGAEAEKVLKLFIGPERKGNCMEFLAPNFSCMHPLVECQSWPEPEPSSDLAWLNQAKRYEAMILAMAAYPDPTPLPEFQILGGPRDGQTFVNRKTLRAYPTFPCPADLKSAKTWEDTLAGDAFDWGAIALAHAHGFQVDIYQLPPVGMPDNVNRNPVPDWLEDSNHKPPTNENWHVA